MFAYIDPGAGGLLTQLVIGGIAGLAVYGKLQWRAIRGFLGRPELGNSEEQVPAIGRTESTSEVEDRAKV